MLSLEEQIKRYGDFLEGEALRGVELEIDAVELQRGRSWFAVAAAVVIVAGLGMWAAIGLGSDSPSEIAAVGDDKPLTTLEQMKLDHSDGIALEVVGDELWILGNGFGAPVVQAPFNVYVTGPEGELIRTIDLGRHFDQMGQSESYVWLVVDGTTQEKPDRAPEIMRISKETGEVERTASGFASGGGPVAFDDSGAWFEVPLSFSSTLARWEWGDEVASQVVTLPERFTSADYPVARSLIYHEGALFYATSDGWIYKVSTDGEELGSFELSAGTPMADFAVSDDRFWALGADGQVTAFNSSLEPELQRSCDGATDLAPLPGGDVMASYGFKFCAVSRFGDRRLEIFKRYEVDQFPAADTAVFAGQLWYATYNIASRISIPIDTVDTTRVSTHEQMNLDRSDGVALEVVGDELWILGGGSEDAGDDGPFNIYVTGPDGELLRKIDVGRRYNQMAQSRSYVWLSAPTASGTARISKATEEIEYFEFALNQATPYVFDDQGAWFPMAYNGVVGDPPNKLSRWDASEPKLQLIVFLADIPEAIDATHIAKGSDIIYLGTSDGWIYRVSPDGQASDGVKLRGGNSPVLDLLSDGGLVWVLQENGMVSIVKPEQEATQLEVCGGATEILKVAAGVIALNGLESCVISGDGRSVPALVTPSPWEVADTALFNGHVWYATSYEADQISYLVTYEIPIVIE